MLKIQILRFVLGDTITQTAVSVKCVEMVLDVQRNTSMNTVLSVEETEFKIETLAGDIGISMKDSNLVKVDMGPPREIKPKKFKSK